MNRIQSLDNAVHVLENANLLTSYRQYHTGEKKLSSNETIFIDTVFSNNWEFSTALNFVALNISTGMNLLVLDEMTELVPESLLSLWYGLQDSSVGIVGSKVITEKGILVHGGIDCSLVNCPEFPQVGCLAPYFVLKGANAFDSRVSDTTEVFAVSEVSFMMSLDLLKEMGGFNVNLPSSYMMLDLCLRAKHFLKKRVIFIPSSIVIYKGGNEGFSFELNDDEKRAVILFNKMWNQEIETRIRDSYILKNLSVAWNTECGTGSVLGFTVEALQFAQALHNKVSFQLVVSYPENCLKEMKSFGIQEYMVSLLERTLYAKLDDKNLVLIIHRDPARYFHFISESLGKLHAQNLPDPFLYIGRSMFETDRIGGDWVQQCNRKEFSEIWVPTKFNVKTFAFSGVMSNKLKAIPEPIDVFFFDPSITKALPLRNRKPFNFLCIMKWEERKGWKNLLRAYLEEFINVKNVSLYMRSSMSSRDEEEYNNFVENFIAQRGMKMDDLPQIVLLKKSIPFEDLPSLYKAVDCFILATHGEGWGLPIIEAMSMELPTIATNWSGNLEYMSKTNSFPIRVEKMVEATENGHYWAEPSHEHLKYLMRYVTSNQKEAKLVGKRARQDIVKGFREEIVAEIVLNELRKQCLPKEKEV